MTFRPGRSDDELAALDLDALITGEGAVAAAVRADRLGVQPRSLTFLAEIVRRGGVDYATGLPEPLPGPDASAEAKRWLAAASDDDPVAVARWLDGVAAVLGMRRSVRLSRS